jgi:hypothetical protein
MDEPIENRLNQSFDSIIFQLSKGNTIEGIKRGSLYMEFEKVKEWKSRFGYQFHIYSNDHFIDNKPHFHFIKSSDEIECRVFFDGTVYDYKGKGRLDKKAKEALDYFLSGEYIQKSLVEFWNSKNPQCKI